MTKTGFGDITGLLHRWNAGEAQALDELLPLLYTELRKLASSQLRGERSEHTLQPTALVHEAYVRMVKQDPGRVETRRHFFALAARAMRQILVDHARRIAAQKRLGRDQRVTLADQSLDSPLGGKEVDVIELHDVLTRFSLVHARAAHVVELRYFGGLTHKEIASFLDVSVPTVARDWEAARLWLRQKMQSDT